MSAINHNALCTASIDRFTVAMEILVNSSGIAERALFCQQDGGEVYFCCLLQAVYFGDAFGIVKRMCFSCRISKYHKQGRALRETRGEFSAILLTSVHSISFSPFYVICF